MKSLNRETAAAEGLPSASSSAVVSPVVACVSLPENPVVVIEPSGAWVAINFRDLWAYRELLFFLTWRDLKVRYKQTSLGVVWAVMQPILTMLIFTLFFGRLAGVKSDGIPYALFAYAGLLPWTFFANAVTTSSNSLVNNSNLITKVYFPRLMIPAAAVAAGLVDFFIAFLLLGGLLVFYGIAPTWNMLMLLPLVLLTTLFALAVGMWMSALNVKYRDIRHALPFVIQLGQFLSPVIYPLSLVPARWQFLYILNPLAGIIEGFRSAIFGRPFKLWSLGVALVVTLSLLCYAAYAFRRTEKTFADII